MPIRCVFGTKVRLDVTEIGRKHRGGQSTWTVTGGGCRTSVFGKVSVVNICIPVFHLRAVFLSFPRTQEKNKDNSDFICRKVVLHPSVNKYKLRGVRKR